ncbi:histone H1.8 [Chroicocephalus ridibundus]|uniref:histone H1.8 n=1 Tax=Chroicocephalus ridibundus TaxID=1192867 RepID=UPI002FDD856D
MEPQLAEAAGTAQLPRPLARGWCASHPSTLHMVIEALRAQDEKKGTSVVAIKRFILAKYPTVDPIRLKYLLKQALSRGLSRGDLVRPRNSSAVGATGRFKLAPKNLQNNQPPGQADPDGGQAPKPGRKRTTKPARAPAAGTVKEKPTVKAAKEKVTAAKAQEKLAASKQKPTVAKAKPRAGRSPWVRAWPSGEAGWLWAWRQPEVLSSLQAQPPATAKPRRDRGKPLQAANRPGKGHSQPAVALAAEDAGGGDGHSLAGAGAKGARKAPVGKSKGKAPKGEQQDVPKVQGGQGKARKPRAAPGAGQGEAGLRKAAPLAAGRKAP